MGQAFGIDLGTTNSLVAIVGEYCRPVVLESIPSVVYYGQNDTTIVGLEAKHHILSHPQLTFVSIKRLLGEQSSKLPQLMLELNKNPIQISADILQKLITQANYHHHSNIMQAVITVPAYFNDRQRQDTKLAAEMAGIKVLRLINEPTAAAIAYGYDNLSSGKILIYDLGGGTLDVSLLDNNNGMLEVIAISGNNKLGGDDFDHALYCHLVKTNNLNNLNIYDQALIREQIKKAKERLSLLTQVQINLQLTSGQFVDATISQDDFVKITEQLAVKALLPIKQVLKDSKNKITDIDDVILVGGATRMPIIIKEIKRFFGGKQPLNSLNPDHIVAMGAALQADKLVNPNKYDWQLLDKTSISYGLETMNHLVEKIIPRNTTIPISKSQIFTTAIDNQSAISLHVVQGESEVVTNCFSLAKFILNNLSPQPAGQAQIEVVFTINADGILQVSAQDKKGDAKRSISISSFSAT